MSALEAAVYVLAAACGAAGAVWALLSGRWPR